VLNEIVGDQAFRKLIRSLLAEFRIRGVTFGDFMSTAEKVSGKKLDRFFSEWIDGTESSRLLMQGIPIGDIVDRY
jgi:aminopeptidase N